MARTITIILHDHNRLYVHEGERYSDGLCWDEMLGQIASMTHPKIERPRYQMLTPEEWQQQRDRWRKPG